jgi:ABC-type lipoprotein release transport system permease subunit
MLSLSCKLLFRKKSTVAAILALALLVAVVASMNTIANFVGSQTSAIGQLARVGDKYLALSKNSTSLSDSNISPETEKAFNSSQIASFYGQKIFNGNLQTASGDYTIAIRGVQNLSAYLNAQSASINGTAAKNMSEADAGVLLASIASLNKNDYANVTVGNVNLTVKIVGVTTTQTQLDSELIVPIETANYLTGNSNLSFIEFTIKEDANGQDPANNVASLLPKNVEVVKVEQTGLLLQQSTGETLSFVALWSAIVYVLVSAASYVIATRLIVESEYELAMLKAIGAKKPNLFSVTFTYTMLTAAAGSVLGIALGIAGTQVASTALRVVWQSIQVTPFLQLAQLAQILVLALLFSALGCIYPALKSMQKKL